MKSGQWKDIAEFVGFGAIAASLIFVGLQLRQSHEIALSGQYQARSESLMDFSLTSIEMNRTIPPLRSHIDNDTSATDIAALIWMWTQFDNAHYQFQSGYMTDEAWQARERGQHEVYSVCHFRFVLDFQRPSFRSSLVALIDSWDDPCAEDD